MAERHQEEAGGAHHREARPAEHRERDAAAPADAVEIAQAVAHHARQEDEARPHVAMQHEVERREPDLDAVLGGNEPAGPHQRGADPAGDAGDEARGARCHPRRATPPCG